MVLKQGDIVIVNLNPTKGREQQGRRPAVILSSDDYYRLTGLLIISPISNTDNKFPMHLKLPHGMKTTGSVLTQHLRTIDPEEREIRFIEKMPADLVEQILNVVNLVFKI